MANTISPNMGLIVPGVGTEPGPEWATDLNADLGILDEHNHTLGQGVPIPVAGLNINANLPMNGNSLVQVDTINFTPNATFLPGTPPNLGAIYVAGNELYYNDETGNVIQITKTGSVNAGAGSITGLPSGTASATYMAGSQTFVWQSATSTPANMDGGSFIFRNILPNSNGVTVEAPASLAFDYTIVLPLPPTVSTSFVTMDTSGNMAATIPITSAFVGPGNIQPATVTLADQVAPNIVISSSSGGFSGTNATFVPVTNLSVTITTTGNPVYINFQPDGANSGQIGWVNASGGQPNISFQILRNATSISITNLLGLPGNFENLFGYGMLNFIDTPPAGTYTYTLQASSTNVDVSYVVQFIVMVVREM